MLKATEAFNKLKKLNDELKNQVGSESQYVSELYELFNFISIVRATLVGK